MTERVFGGSGRYVQGPGAIDDIGAHVAVFGTTALVLIDEFVHPILGPRLLSSLAAASVATTMHGLAVEVTVDEIAAAAELAPDNCDVVIGVGGGKTIDVSKGVARELGLPVVTVPTIASNDSPASRAIAIYDANHRLSEVPLLDRNPVLVVVDTAVIAAAPSRFLAAGIGDAIAKHAEVSACRAVNGSTMQGTPGLRIASVIAAGCYAVLREHAVAAVAAVEAGTRNAALEETVEAVVLMSGLAFENGGLSIAHALTRGLMATSGADRRLHGEHVAYGLLVQLALEGESDDVLVDMATFLRSLGLPRSLAELGAEHDVATLSNIADAALSAPHAANSTAEVGVETLISAMSRVEVLSLTATQPPDPSLTKESSS